jgi:hypothetical protein
LAGASFSSVLYLFFTLIQTLFILVLLSASPFLFLWAVCDFMLGMVSFLMIEGSGLNMVVVVVWSW